jgi:hypothetical protein
MKRQLLYYKIQPSLYTFSEKSLIKCFIHLHIDENFSHCVACTCMVKREISANSRVLFSLGSHIYLRW